MRFDNILQLIEHYFPEYDLSFNGDNRIFLTKMFYPYSIYVIQKEDGNIYSIRFADMYIEVNLDNVISKEQEELIRNIKYIYDDILVNRTRRFISIDVGNLRMITSILFDFKNKQFDAVIYDISNLDTFFTNSFLYQQLERIIKSNNQYETLQQIYDEYFKNRYKYIDKVIEHFYITRCTKKDDNKLKPYIILGYVTYDNVLKFQKCACENSITKEHFKLFKKYLTFKFTGKVTAYISMLARKFGIPIIKVSELNTSNIEGDINDRDLKACLNMLKINFNINRIIENRINNNEKVIDNVERYLPIVL